MKHIEIRDILAIPFYLLALLALNINLWICGKLTAEKVMEFMTGDKK